MWGRRTLAHRPSGGVLPYEPARLLPPLLNVALQVDTARVAAAAALAGRKGADIGIAIQAAREERLHQMLQARMHEGPGL